MQGADDESLSRYTKAILGDLAEGAKFTGEPGLVEILKVELLCEDRPGGPVVLDFKEVRFLS